MERLNAQKCEMVVMTGQGNWITVTESNFPWEREALEFVKARFPQQLPHMAWSNFEFLATDGSINEVDLLVFTPKGFFLIEIKSRPGRLTGDPGTWTWETEGKRFTYENPLYGANRKAKKLRSLLQRQNVFKGKKAPFIEALVFCSAVDLKCDLFGIARQRVCLRDREAQDGIPGRDGIMAAILERQCPGLESAPRTLHDRPVTKLVVQGMEQAGIRKMHKRNLAGDYELTQIIDEGPGYQDWGATHVQLKRQHRVRIYLVRQEASQADRQAIERAAERECHILETVRHTGVLYFKTFTRHELGPALVFDHDPDELRLDLFLTQYKDTLSVDVRLNLIRQIAEVVQFAHDKRVINRGLCPQNILVTGYQHQHPRIKIVNWQLGYRAGSATPGYSQEVTATSHIDQWTEDVSTAYMAPEALTDRDFIGEHLDIFSLGAIAYHLFSGQPPAANGVELNDKLRENKGLQVSAAMNGAPVSLQSLIQDSTHPDVDYRTEDVATFLEGLDLVEEELTAPENEFIENPSDAQKGDILPGGFVVRKRLGQGSTAIGFLVERGEELWVLKVANDPDHNEQLQQEAEALQKLRHPNIVEFGGLEEIGNRVGVLMQPVLVNRKKDDPQVETLGQRLRREGRLHIDLLQRFGEDLLSIVNFLDEKGVNHRDIKPDNIAIGQMGRSGKLRLALFDFSLTQAPLENIRAGTTGYLDPMLPLRQPPLWDLHAERYAASVTLYQMAAADLPKWGDGPTDPSHLDCEVTINPELFDVSLRESLADFFTQAFQRDVSKRFDNAEDMLREWRRCFDGIEEPGALLSAENEEALKKLLAEATRLTPILELGLGTRATNALDRFNVLTVEDLLEVPPRRLQRLRGIGHQTRREILTAKRLLWEQLGASIASDLGDLDDLANVGDVKSLSVDRLLQHITRPGKTDGEVLEDTLNALLGLEPQFDGPWPTAHSVAEYMGMSPKQTSTTIAKLRKRWDRKRLVTGLRAEVAELLGQQYGGAASEAELTKTLRVIHGSTHPEPQVSMRRARALLRLAVETESIKAQPRFRLERQGEAETGQRLLIVQSPALAECGFALGQAADEMALADPLLPPERVWQQLQEIGTAAGLGSESLPFPEAQILRLAIASSSSAALSSRQEIYPCNMAAERALRLSHGALSGVRQLTVEQIRERISSRYPEAEPLPDRPKLDELVQAVLPDLRWDQTQNDHRGCYVSRVQEWAYAASTSSTMMGRWPTRTGMPELGEIAPEVADARMFGERLQRNLREGAFMALLIRPDYYQRAIAQLCDRFPLKQVNFEALFLQTLQAVAAKANVDWELVLQTDAKPHQGDWDKLMVLVNRAMAAIEAELAAMEETVLLLYPGVLARYGHMTMLERLREQVGQPEGLPGLWLLLPNDYQAMINGQAVPLLGPGQRVKISMHWLENRHRGREPSPHP